MATGFTLKVIEKDLGWRGIARGVATINGATVRAGLVGEKAAKVHEDSTMTNAEIGTVHEFGAPAANIPERSFLRSTFRKNKDKYNRLMGALAAAVYSARAGSKGALALLGATMVSDIKATIRAGIPPPLAAATVARRSKRKKDREIPLIDTREFINAISYLVEVPNAAKEASLSGLALWSNSNPVSGLQNFSDSFAPPDLQAFALR